MPSVGWMAALPQSWPRQIYELTTSAATVVIPELRSPTRSLSTPSSCAEAPIPAANISAIKTIFFIIRSLLIFN